MAGGGGIGGAGGIANATVAGNIMTSGALAYGLLVQAVAGFGGASGHTGDIFSTGGSNGGAGGVGGSASVTSTGGVINTSGTGAIGIVAQSVGGGGGAGGNASAGGGNSAIGGTGGTGGVGQAATLNLANTTITRGNQATGAVALSVGGGGGNGGNAYDNGAEVSITIGGDGNTGGNGGTASVTNGGLVTTFASHAGGIQAQSIGGGGGNGGSAISKADGVTLALSVAVGGTGGNGGNSGQVTVTNNFQTTTYGADSYGLKAQAIAGGGGNGGSSFATATATAGGNQNAISMSASIGGAGGTGGDGTSSTVLLTNNAFVATGGDGGIGLIAQNIAGGGGSGGESNAGSFSDGTTTSNTASITLGVGGTGGVGGTAGSATIDNKALVLTLGESGYGLFAQSIGGGGGQGSGGDSAAKNTPSDLSGKFTVTLGGNGGGGGSGGIAVGDNAGGIATVGDGARGMVVQSVGGGGGAAGGAAGKASGSGGLTINVTLGGTGGTGGTSAEADGYNHLGIVTAGADADGMFVQSVGGGGGTGGKAASTKGGAADSSDLTHQLQTAFANGLGVGQGATLVAGTSDVYQIGDGQLSSINGIAQLQQVINSTQTASLGDDDGDDGSSTGSLSLTLKMGNDGGTGGDGARAYAYNEGAISTTGAKSDGIFVQSVGGGGGAGGAVSFSDFSSPSASLIMGGSGGAGGNGNAAQLNNATEAEVFTSGVTSMALVAQSIGGGGGKGGVTASTGGGLKHLTVTVGGMGGTAGTGGDVIVNDDVGSYLSTRGKNAIGILAQSVGGGGGITSVLSKEQTGAGGDSDSDASSIDAFGYSLSLGNTSTKAGASDGGTVTINDPQSLPSAGIGYIRTSGRNAYGILAQSIGGGGGLVVGGNPTGSSFFGGGTMVGNGNTVTVEVGNAMSTTGQGAIGIIAQSIGGGGILAGDTGWTQQRQAFSESGTHIGNGGNILVTLDQTGSITTSAGNSPAIWAQSLGGGGGLVNTGTGAAYAGSAGGTGTGGTIGITVNGVITVTGVASNGVLAQSLGDANSNSPITVTIGNTGNIQAGLNTVEAFDDGTSAGVYLDHGGLTSAAPNVVTNNGTLYTYSSVRNSVAVWSVGGYTQITNNGTMGGDLLLQNGGGQGCFTNNGSFYAGDTVSVGPCGVSNFGRIDIKATTTGTTTITGPYSGSGTIVFDADFAAGKSDKLLITGKATIAGAVEVRPSSISNTKLALMTASGGLTLDPQLTATKGNLFSYKVETDGTSLFVTPQARFNEQASALGGTRRAVASGLQALFDSGTRLDAGFTRLAALATPEAYANALDNLSGRALGGIAAYRYQASRNFVSNFNEGCRLQDQRDGRNVCTWARAQVGHTRQDENDDALGYRASAQTYELGAQAQVGTNLYLNAAAAYEHNRVRDQDRTARVTGDSFLGGIGLRYLSGALEFSGAVDGSYGWYNSQRTITLGAASDVARAQPRVWNVGAHLATAYTIPLGQAWLRPFAELRGVQVRAIRYSERGNSPFNLDVGSDSDFAVSGSAGATLGASLPLGGGARLRPFASAAVEFASDTDWNTTAHFAGQSEGDSFTTRTRSPGTFGRFAVGVDLIGSSNLEFGISYTPEFGREYSLQQGTARLTWRF